MCESCSGQARQTAVADASAGGPGVRRSRFRITGMDCGGCAAKIDTAVRRLSGVRETSVSVAAGALVVTHEETLAASAIRERVAALGYGAEEIAPAQASPPSESPPASEGGGDRPEEAGPGALDPTDGGAPWWATPKARLTFGCGLALAVAYALGHLFPDLKAPLLLVALMVGLAPIARRAFDAARYGSWLSIETLMTIAAIGAVLIGAAEEAGAVVFLFLVGEMLEGVAAGRARASIKALTKLTPSTALLERPDGVAVETPAADLRVGDVVLVRPGDRLPADGVVLAGAGGVDEAPITGESVPKRKEPGDDVFAGAINLEAVLRVRVAAAAADNTIARVVRLVEEAQEAKAPTERFIDRFSRYYTPAVLAAGALVAVVPPAFFGASWPEWIYKGLALLLIGCPCALVISTPAAIAAGLAAGARRGLLMKGGAVLEQLGRVTLVAFDKTGTLTAGKPVVTDLVGIGRSDREVLARAAALEAGSSHPLAKAITAHAASLGVAVPPASDIRSLDGKGMTGRIDGMQILLASPAAAGAAASVDAATSARVEALNDEGKTVSLLVEAGEVTGLIAMRDEARPDARAAIAALAGLGVRSLMLTGDNRRAAGAIARDLGLEPRAELMPADKQDIVRALQAEGAIVAKVGDGINDAPALAAAHVGVAMGGGTDVALETADAASLYARAADIPRMVLLSRRTMRNIWQNIALALALKAVFLVTTVLGVTGLWPAILADTGATVLVTANAMRLLAVKLP